MSIRCDDEQSQSVVLQATPRPKPRAFPRTNPSYVRGGHSSSYRHISESGCVFRADDENPYSVLSDSHHWPITSHSFDVCDSPSAVNVCRSVVSV